MTNYLEHDTPIGRLLLLADEAGLTEIRFARDEGHDIEAGWAEGGALVREAARQLDAYFAGTLREFDLPLAAQGTDFMKHVWSELVRIPFGQTLSYGELAQRIGNPNASRAVGLANGKNPLPIVVPCHRVIGANGELTGFAGGLDVKRRLLQHEGCAPPTEASLFGA